MTWAAHFLVGFGLGLLVGQYGAGWVAGMYGWKEYLESEKFKAIKLDNVMDFVSPLIGGLTGWWIRCLVS